MDSFQDMSGIDISEGEMLDQAAFLFEVEFVYILAELYSQHLIVSLLPNLIVMEAR